MPASETPKIKTWAVITLLIFGVIAIWGGSLSAIDLHLGDIEEIETSGIIESKRIRKGRQSYKSNRRTRHYLTIDYIIEKDGPLKYMDVETYESETLRRGRNLDLQRLSLIKRHKFTSEEQFNIDLFSREIRVRKPVYSDYNKGDEITLWYRADNPWKASLSLEKDRFNSLMAILLGFFFLVLGLFLAWKKDKLDKS